MDDDPVPRECMGQTDVRRFITNILSTVATVTKAQKQKVLLHKSDDDPKTKIKMWAKNICSPALKKEKIRFDNDISYFTSNRKNKYRHYTYILGIISFVTDNHNLKKIISQT